MDNEMIEYQEQLGQVIRQQREKLGLSQPEAAEKLGMSRTSYAYYELGKICPDALTLRKMAEVLETDVSALAYPENKPA
jgi:transcriptional regulator with XRE-family HTH domain